MILQILSYIGWFILFVISFLLITGVVIALLTVFYYWKFCRKIKNGEESYSTQDLKKTTKFIKETNQVIPNKLKTDDASEKSIWTKPYDIAVILLWVVAYSIWFVLMCIAGFFLLIYDLVTYCFNKNKVIH